MAGKEDVARGIDGDIAGMIVARTACLALPQHNALGIVLDDKEIIATVAGSGQPCARRTHDDDVIRRIDGHGGRRIVSRGSQLPPPQQRARAGILEDEDVGEAGVCPRHRATGLAGDDDGAGAIRGNRSGGIIGSRAGMTLPDQRRRFGSPRRLKAGGTGQDDGSNDGCQRS